MLSVETEEPPLYTNSRTSLVVCTVLINMIGAYVIASYLFQNSKLTLTMPSSPLPKVIEQIARASGERLAVSTVFAEEPFVVNVENVTSEELTTKIAYSLYGKWVPQKDGVRMLVSDTQALAKRRELVDNQSQKDLHDGLIYVQMQLTRQPAELDDKAVKEIKRRLAIEEQLQNAATTSRNWDLTVLNSDTNELVPSWRATAKLVLGLDPKVLQQMPDGSREVWSDQPTEMQHRLPDNTDQILETYRRELGLFSANKDIRRVLIIVRKWNETHSFNISLQALDGTGRIVDTGFLQLRPDADRLKIPLKNRDALPQTPNESVFEVSDEVSDARLCLQSMGKDKRRSQILSKWLPKFKDPVHYEPTQWHMAADLTPISQSLHLNFVGSPSDRTLGNYWEKENLTPTQYLLRHKEAIDVSQKGWLILRRPIDVTRSSRSEARDFIRSSTANGGVSVDSAAAWASKSSDNYAFVCWLGDHLNILFTAHGPYSTLATLSDSSNLRLWHSLGDASREGLRRGNSLKVEDLNGDAKEILRRLVFWEEAIDDKEPTDLFPQGIKGGTLSLSIQEKPILVGWNSNAPRSLADMPLDPTMLGRLSVSGNPFFKITSNEYQSWNRYLLGVNRKYRLKIMLEPGHYPFTIALTETFIKPGQSPRETLPSEFAKAIAEAKASARRRGTANPNKNGSPPPLL